MAKVSLVKLSSVSKNPDAWPGFEISLVRSSETSKNDSWTSGIPAGLVRRTTGYFWFSHKLYWLYIFQTCEWYIRTSDFYNPLARRTSAFNLKFRSLMAKHWHSNTEIDTCCNNKSTWSKRGISSTQVSDSHLSPPGALQSRRAYLQRT